MKIPKSMPCASHVYTTRFVKNLIRDVGNRGQITWHTQLIEFEDTLEGSILNVSVWHEITHQIDRHYNNDSLDEDTVNRMAEGFAQVFGDMGITFER